MKNSKTSLAALLFATCSIAALPIAGHAASEKDLQVAARTFAFVQGVPAGNLNVPIIYNSADPASKADAEATHAVMQGGLKAGKHTLTSTLVDLGSIGSANGKVAYVATNVGDYNKVGSTAASKGMLTFTTDFGCVNAQKCVMGVASSPNVKIEISRSAASASNLEFEQALKLMVTEKD